MTRINAKTRRKANRSLSGLPTYHKTPGLALGAIQEVLDPLGLTFGLVYQPKTGRTTVVITAEGQEVDNSVLVVQTHLMEESGRVELTTYLS